MRYYLLCALKFSILILLARNVHAQTSKSVTENLSVSSTPEKGDLMCILLKAPNDEFPEILLSPDSIHENMEEFIDLYGKNHESFTDMLNAEQFEILQITRTNYYSLEPQKQIELKEKLTALEELFKREIQSGLIKNQHFLVSKKDFEAIIKIISTE
ncbi:MAG: hypothetical protein RIT43_245 [Bacteroidota bacterium]|jgi:hypothetical protein